MNCETCHSLVMEFAYDELDERMRAEVEAALEKCPECRAELAELRRTAQAFDTIEPLEVPAKLHNDILRAARIAAVEAKPARSKWSAFLASPAFSAALALGILVGGGAVFYQMTYGGAYAPEANYATETVVASATDEAAGPMTREEAEQELAEELGPTTEPEPLTQQQAAAPENMEDPTEGRHSLERLADNEARAEDALNQPRPSFDLDREEDDRFEVQDTVLGENRASERVGGTVSGASSAGRGIADLDPSSVQRGSGRASAYDDSRLGNMASSAARPTGPSRSEPTPNEPSARESAPDRNRSGNLGSRRNRDRASSGEEGTERSTSPVRTREDSSDAYAGLAPPTDDSHAPRSAATIDEARVLAPTASVPPPEAEPEAVVVAAAPAPPPTSTRGYEPARQQQGYGQPSGGEAGGGGFDGSLAAAELEPEEQSLRYEEEYEEGGYAHADVEADSDGPAREVSISEPSSDSSRASDFDIGSDHYDNGRYGRASQALSRFLDDASPDDSRRGDARYLLGAALYQQGDYSLARAELERFLRDHPGHGYTNQAQMLLGDIIARDQPRNRQLAPVEAFDSMEEAE